MSWAWLASIASTATVMSASITLLTFMATVPFSPARFWSWRLRKHGQTVAALDTDRHKNQREVLLRTTDYLASKAAATQQIPTPWKRYVVGSFIWTYFAWLLFLLVKEGPTGLAPGARGHCQLEVVWTFC